MTVMAAIMKQSANNPFRSPMVTPVPTGAGPSTPAAADPQEGRRPESRPRTPQTNTAQGTSPRRDIADDLAAELQSVQLEDSTPPEPPPAYTPSANPYEGEATVEYGPRRPFQPPPPAPPLPPQFTGMSAQQQPHFTGVASGTTLH